MKNELKKLKVEMTRDMLDKAGAVLVGTFTETTTNLKGDISKDGYYFVCGMGSDKVLARFFAGRQRSNQGFLRTLNRIKAGESQVNRDILAYEHLDLFYIQPNEIKYLFGIVEPNWFKRAFTKTHSTIYQNLNEVNRMMNDKFKFVLQKY